MGGSLIKNSPTRVKERQPTNVLNKHTSRKPVHNFFENTFFVPVNFPFVKVWKRSYFRPFSKHILNVYFDYDRHLLYVGGGEVGGPLVAVLVHPEHPPGLRVA